MWHQGMFGASAVCPGFSPWPSRVSVYMPILQMRKSRLGEVQELCSTSLVSFLCECPEYVPCVCQPISKELSSHHKMTIILFSASVDSCYLRPSANDFLSSILQRWLQSLCSVFSSSSDKCWDSRFLGSFGSCMATVIGVELLIPSLGLPVPSCQVVINEASAQSCCENQPCNPKEGQDPLAIRWAETSMCWSGYELKGTYRGH